MKKSKKFIAACSITLGIGAGAILFSPQGMSASSNLVLASVDWVSSQLNPINAKVTGLETKINAQQKEIDNLKAQLAQGAKPTTPSTPTPPATSNPDVNNEAPTTVYVAKSSVTVHSGATRDYKVVSTQTKNTQLKVIDSFKSSTGLWYRVEISASVKGWVHSDDVSTSKSPTASPTQVEIKSNVHLRKGATTDYSILETLQAGSTVKYIQSFVNAKGETWYNVESSTGKKGWMISTLGEVK